MFLGGRELFTYVSFEIHRTGGVSVMARWDHVSIPFRVAVRALCTTASTCVAVSNGVNDPGVVPVVERYS
jgi:hypothetical protein